MIAFSVMFGRIAGLPAEGATPYLLLVFAGMIAWFLFSTVLNETSNSLVSNTRLVAKDYFPRLIIPVETNRDRVIDGRNVSCCD
jgi:lipopolysaccharide transport system permease protein